MGHKDNPKISVVSHTDILEMCHPAQQKICLTKDIHTNALIIQITSLVSQESGSLGGIISLKILDFFLKEAVLWQL